MFFKKSKRSPILLTKLEIENTFLNGSKTKKDSDVSLPSNNTIIAVTGTSRGAGCTFIALNIAFNLSKNNRVAILELDKKSELKNFKKIYSLKSEEYFFCLEKVDIFQYGTDLDLLMQLDYNYIILDTGYYFDNSDNGLIITQNMKEVYRADFRVAVMDLREWKQQYVASFIDNISRFNDWFFVGNLVTNDDFETFKKSIKNKQNLTKVDFLENFFDQTDITEKLLSSNN